MTKENKDRVLSDVDIRNKLSEALGVSIPQTTIDAWKHYGHLKTDEKGRVRESDLQKSLPGLRKRVGKGFVAPKKLKGGVTGGRLGKKRKLKS